ncbi:MAG: PilZ domain-containing protein [Deltaproteobacteria bacterium]|nr:PilZ domain-containing protein [Deltaproteobacteria bacterium]
MTTSERRTSPRFLLTTPVRVEFGSAIQRYQTINVSRGGVFIECPRPLSLGTEVLVRFEVPDAGKVNAYGVVRHRNPLVVAEPGQPERRVPGMGIMFTRIEGDGAQRLIEFIQKLSTPAP